MFFKITNIKQRKAVDYHFYMKRNKKEDVIHIDKVSVTFNSIHINLKFIVYA